MFHPPEDLRLLTKGKECAIRDLRSDIQSPVLPSAGKMDVTVPVRTQGSPAADLKFSWGSCGHLSFKVSMIFL